MVVGDQIQSLSDELSVVEVEVADRDDRVVDSKVYDNFFLCSLLSNSKQECMNFLLMLICSLNAVQTILNLKKKKIKKKNPSVVGT